MSSKGWELFTFSDFVTINPSVKLDSSTEYSFVEMKNLNENYRYVSPSITRKLTGGARFQEKDTLFARITPCLENGKICQVTNLQNGVGFGSTEFLVFRGKAGISDSDFVYYLSRSAEVRKFAELNMLGTSGRQRVTWKAFNNLQLTLPPLPTQHSIVEILSALDDKIELNRQTNATLEDIAQAIFKEWFVDFNYPGATGEMVDSELGPIPKGWQVGNLGEILFLKNETISPGSYPDKLFSHFSIPAFDSGRFPSKEFGSQILSNKFKVKQNSILVSKLNPRIPRIWPIKNLDEASSICSTEFLVLTPAKPSYYSYAVNLLSQPSIQETMRSRASGTSSSHQRISPKDLLSIMISIPSDDLITSFERIVGNYFHYIGNSLDEMINLSKIRDQLLPYLINSQNSLGDES